MLPVLSKYATFVSRRKHFCILILYTKVAYRGIKGIQGEIKGCFKPSSGRKVAKTDSYLRVMKIKNLRVSIFFPFDQYFIPE